MTVIWNKWFVKDQYWFSPISFNVNNLKYASIAFNC